MRRSGDAGRALQPGQAEGSTATRLPRPGYPVAWTPSSTAVGAAIRELREARGVSQGHVARIVSDASSLRARHGTLSRIESGSRLPSIEMLGRIMDALSCDTGERRRLLVAWLDSHAVLPGEVYAPLAGVQS